MKEGWPDPEFGSVAFHFSQAVLQQAVCRYIGSKMIPFRG
jgi:hypothetical protein